MADVKRRKVQGIKVPPKKITRFTPGQYGVCEAQLWEFSGPSKFLPEGEEVPVKRIAAGSLDAALKFMRYRYPDFTIVKAIAAGIIVMLSGSPFE